MGIGTFEHVVTDIAWLLDAVSRIAIGIILIALGLRLIGNFRGFFRSFWNVFDLSIVVVLIGFSAPYLAALLVLRVLKLLRNLAEGVVLVRLGRLLLALVREFGIALMLSLLMLYAFAILTSQLFAGGLPAWFSDVFTAFKTLVRILFIDIWFMEMLPEIGARYPVVWVVIMAVWACLFLIWLNFALGILLPAELEVVEEEELIEAAVSEFRLMTLETELVQQEFAVEAEAERLLIRAETDRILSEIQTLKDEMAGYRQRYSR